MSETLRDRIAAVLHSHLLAISDDWITCSCDDHFSRFTGTTFEWHVADAVIQELGLQQEDGECGYCHAQLPGCRYVTECETNDG